MYIYAIKNKLNGKQYVGQTVRTIKKRFQGHCWSSSMTLKKMPIAVAIQKYGRDNFEVRILYECFSQDELNRMETYFIKGLNTSSPNGYNLTTGGDGLGQHSEETRRKISLANKGKKVSAETRRKLSESHKGLKLSVQAKKKLSDRWKGIPASPQAYEAMRKAVEKTYDLTSPNESVVRIRNMRQFCKDRKLSASKMCEVVRGKRTHYKGWTGTIVESAERYLGRRRKPALEQ